MAAGTYGPGFYPNGILIADTPATIDSATYITNPGGTAVYVGVPAAALYNNGTIASHGTVGAPNVGVDLYAGGAVTNSGTIVAVYTGLEILQDPGTVANLGVIASTYAGSPSDGVYLAAGGTVTNGSSTDTTALTQGYVGVAFGADGTLINDGTVSGTGRYGADLVDGGAVTNQTAGLIEGSTGVYLSGFGTVLNYGTITGSSGDGVELSAGGYVTNAAGGTIDGTFNGVYIGGAAGTVTNSGVIEATAGTYGVLLAAGGTVTNGAGGSATAVIEGYTGVAFRNGAGALYNYGTISGTGAFGYGAYLGGGGTVTNEAFATIDGWDGVKLSNTYGAVINDGTIVQNGGGGFGAYFAAGGSLANHGLVEGAVGVHIYARMPGFVANYGTIVGTYGAGADVGSGVTVANYAGATISGNTYGLVVRYGTATVVNSGTIEATGTPGVGIEFAYGGTLTNYGSITGGSDGFIAYGYGTVTNDGVIAGTTDDGVYLADGGDVTNAETGEITGYAYGIRITGSAGAVSNYGGIGANGTGVDLSYGGTVINGTSLGTSAYIGGGTGIAFGPASGTVDNFGTIVGTAGAAVSLDDGGSVTNHASGLIAGFTGVSFYFSPGTITNYGTIIGTYGDGVYVGYGSTVINAAGATISGGSYGVVVFGAGTETNSGTIEGTGPSGIGVEFRYGGSLTNYGSITGVYTGVQISGTTGYVTNLGEIQATGGYPRSYGVTLGGGGVVTNGTTGNTTAVIRGYVGVGSRYSPLTLINYGTVSGSGTYRSAGAYFGYGGAVTNHAQGLIEGPAGVVFSYLGGTGTVLNSGTISGTGGGAVYFEDGGTVVNYSGATITGRYIGIAAYGTAAITNDGTIEGFVGVAVAGGAGTVVNYGTILGTNPSHHSHSHGDDHYNTGVYLTSAGLVENKAGALIEGNYGVLFGYGRSGSAPSYSYDLGTLLNYGTITTYAHGRFGVGIVGGTIVNGASGSGGAVISGYSAGIFARYFDTYPTPSLPTITNFGTVASEGTAGIGIVLDGGGAVTNEAGGRIIGGEGIGGSSGTVLNYGTIAGTIADAIYIEGYGFVANGPSGSTGAVISGVEHGVDLGSGTVANYGTIETGGTSGVAVYFYDGGFVTNAVGGTIGGSVGVGIYGASGTVLNLGRITDAPGGDAVYLGDGGSVTNGTGGYIGGHTGVRVEGNAGVVVNLGTIETGGASATVGVYLGAGGVVTNGTLGDASPLIEGFDGLQVSYGTASLINYGTISAGNIDAYFEAGGYVVNKAGALLSSSGTGVSFGSGAGGPAEGTLLNYGSIETDGSGAYLRNGGTVVNYAGGTIGSGVDGVYARNAAVTVTNQGTITGGSSGGQYGVRLTSGGVVTNGGSGDTTAVIGGYIGIGIGGTSGRLFNYGTIAGYGGGVVFDAAAGRVANSGLISATATFGSAVRLGEDDTLANTGTVSAAATAVSGTDIGVYNGVTGSTGGLITAADEGISASGTSKVVNYGTIRTTGTGSTVAVALSGNGTLRNPGLIVSTGTGVQLGGTGTVANTGSIVASGTSSVGVAASGGTIDNGQSGSSAVLISGYRFGVYASGTATGIANYGTITATGTSGAIAVDLTDSGTVANHGTISSGVGGVYVAGTSGPNVVINAAGGDIAAGKIAIDTGQTVGTILNYGIVTDSGSTNAAVYLGGGGQVVNGSTGDTAATISAAARTGVAVKNAPATVTNFGTISSAAAGTAGAGVYFNAGGALINEASGLVTAYRSAVSTASTAATVVNYGILESTGTKAPTIYLGAGGRIVNGSSGVTGALIESTSGNTIVVDNGAGSLVNFGTILGSGAAGTAIYFNHGGTITNEAGASISAYHNAVDIGVTAATLINYGSLSVTGDHVAVYSDAGGTILNGATAEISGARGAVTLQHAAGTVVNYGTLAATGASGPGVYLGAGGTIDNAAGALITGVSQAVELGGTAAATLDNFGTLITTGTSGVALDIAVAGTVVNYGTIGSGIFVGGSATTTGTVSVVNSAAITGAIGIDFSSLAVGVNAIVNFGTITGTGGTAVALAGNASTLVIEPGSLLDGSVANFHRGDVIDFAHAAANGFAFDSGTLTLTGNGTVVGTVALSGIFSTGAFAVTSDQAGGTDVRVAGSVFTGFYPAGIALVAPGIENPATITSSAYVTNGSTGNDNSAVYGASGTAWIVYNAGTIVAGSSTGADGILLASGGTIGNTGTIVGGHGGDAIDLGGAGSVANSGVIEGPPGAPGIAIYLSDGGSITNQAGGTITAYGNAIKAAMIAGTVSNYGSIASTGPSTAIALGAGGLIVNGSSANPTAAISADESGISVTGGTGTVINYGTITDAGTSGYAIALSGGTGSVVNSGLVQGPSSGTAGAGIYLADGGTVINDAGGTIAGYLGAVTVAAAAGTLLNYGSIGNTGTASAAVAFGVGGTVVNGSSHDQAATIGSSPSGISVTGGAGTVTNYGTILSTTTTGLGSAVYMTGGGTVTNAAGALIASTHTGVAETGVAGTVINDGTIQSTSTTTGSGIYQDAGGVIVNNAGGTIAGADSAIRTMDVASTVLNYGLIASTSPGAEMYFGAGGTVLNGSAGDTGAAIYGAGAAIMIEHAAGTVTNFGTISASRVTYSLGVYLGAGGSVTNEGGGQITGSAAAVVVIGTTGTVTNYGSIESTSTGTVATAVYLGAGGTVTNAANGSIVSHRDGVTGLGGAVTVDNAGLIESQGTGSAAYGVYLGKGGRVVNGSPTDAAALIVGGTIALKAANVAATVVNYGTISTGAASASPAVYLAAGGSVTNKANGQILGNGVTLAHAPGTVTNYGTIRSSEAGTSGRAVYLGAGGTVTNGPGGSIIADYVGIGGAGSAVTVANDGLIESAGTGAAAYGVLLAGGGEVVNGSPSDTAARIVGGYASIETEGTAATTVNYGTIANYAAGAGVYIKGGGRIVNGSLADTAATIQSTIGTGVAIGDAAATVVNYGTILTGGTYSGIGIYSLGSLFNAGLIAGGVGSAAAGVYIGNTYATTGIVAVTNSGTITGSSIGIEMSSFGVGPTTIVNYGTIQGNGGTAIRLSGAAATLVIEPGSAIAGAVADLEIGDRIDFAHEIGTAVSLSGGVLDLLNGNSVVGSVALSGTFTAGEFTLISDGAGGTVIGLNTTALSGTGLSDTLMTSTGTGALFLDEVSGATMSYTEIGSVEPEWQFEGMGPLLGDGTNQFLMYYGTDDGPNFGAVVVGEVAGGTAQYTQIGSVGPEWQFEGVGALTRGGNAEFLMWDGSSTSTQYGSIVVGTVVGGSAQYTQIGAVGPEWQFEGVGGFLNNGSTGFLLWDTDSASSQYGVVAVGQDVGGTTHYTAIGGLDPTAWQFEGSGDLLNDGKDSFLLRNVTDGVLVVGEVNGGTTDYTAIGGVGPEWQFLGVGNYDGSSPAEFLMWDGKSSGASGDLVLGKVAPAGGTYGVSYVRVGGVGPTEWNFHTINPAVLS